MLDVLRHRNDPLGPSIILLSIPVLFCSSFHVSHVIELWAYSKLWIEVVTGSTGSSVRLRESIVVSKPRGSPELGTDILVLS